MIPVDFQLQSLRSEDEIRGVILQEFGKYGSVNYLNLHHLGGSWWYVQVGFEPRENPIPPWLIPFILGVVAAMVLPWVAEEVLEVMMMLMMMIFIAVMLYSVAYPMLPPPVKERIRRWLKYE